MLEVKNLCKTFGDKTAVDKISFQVKPGVITGLLGPNGAGKTTTMRLITGFLQPTEGSVYYQGTEIKPNSTELKQKLGYLPESAALYQDMLVHEYLEFIAKARGITDDIDKKINAMVELCELKPHYHYQIGQLSKGLRQRVMLAGTLVHDPEIIILDEPTSGLDPNQISHIRELIKKLGKEKILILSTHILQEVEDVCDEVIIIHQGKIVANSPVSALQEHNQVLVKTEANRQELENAIPGAIVSSLAENDANTFLLRKNDLQPEEVFRALCAIGKPVTELRAYKKSLESIFEELTR